MGEDWLLLREKLNNSVYIYGGPAAAASHLTKDQTALMICTVCSNSFETKFCSTCGAPASAKRIDSHYIVHELQHDIVHLEKGFLFTVKELTLHPGIAVRRFLQGDRARYYKPVGFLIVCSVLYTVMSHWLHHKVVRPVGEGNTEQIMQWIESHYNYANLIEILFIALSYRLFFRKKQFNYFEQLVLLAYLTGYGMLLGIVFMLLQWATGLAVFDSIFLVIVLMYTVWGTGQFFDSRSWSVYFKALLAYMLGAILFWLSAMLLGLILDAMHLQL